MLCSAVKSWEVALRKESVDRNDIRIAPINGVIDVALRKESVDRNQYRAFCRPLLRLSLSARRAWIEIPCTQIIGAVCCASLSARRAWIEIPLIVSAEVIAPSRSPQGERG